MYVEGAWSLPQSVPDRPRPRGRGRLKLNASNVRVLPVKGDPKSLLELSPKQLDELRAPLLRPFRTSFTALNRVALYLFRDGSWVVENFNDEAVSVEFNHEPQTIPGRGWNYRWQK